MPQLGRRQQCRRPSLISDSPGVSETGEAFSRPSVFPGGLDEEFDRQRVTEREATLWHRDVPIHTEVRAVECGPGFEPRNATPERAFGLPVIECIELDLPG